MTEETKIKLPVAKAFWDLIVYQRARSLQGRVFELTRRFPKEETYSLTDQFRRAARSIGAQLSEAWGKRDYQKHFTSKLSDADSEKNETQHWIITSVDDGYLTRDEGKELMALANEIGRMLNSMSNRASEFCPDASRLCDPSSEWFDCHASLNFPLGTEH